MVWNWCPFWFINHLAEGERAGFFCFTFVVLSLSVFCIALPRDVVSKSAIVAFPSHSHLLFNWIASTFLQTSEGQMNAIIIYETTLI